MSKIDYDKNRRLVNVSKEIFPAYYLVEAEKAKCRPPGIEAPNAHEVVVPLQSLLDHTVARILEDPDIQDQVERLVVLNDNEPILLEFLYKYGFDGTSGLGKFKQSTDSEYAPGALYASNMVALQLVTYVKGRIHILYNNPLCNSSLAVRPIRHQYLRETFDLIQEEDRRLKVEIGELTDFEWSGSVRISYIGFCSMCDQKVVNAVNDNKSSLRCPFCGASPKDVNQIEMIFISDPEIMAILCLSVLHFGIRGTEHIFKVGFNQDFKQYQCRGEENIVLKAARREKILKRFKDLGCFTLMINSHLFRTEDLTLFSKLFQHFRC